MEVLSSMIVAIKLSYVWVWVDLVKHLTSLNRFHVLSERERGAIIAHECMCLPFVQHKEL